MEDILLSPYAPNLIESTRSIGYSFETALADIIDNSISNFARKVDVKFSRINNPYVAIIDNGIGMTFSELKKAMQYGSSNSLDIRDKNDLGRFGLGLKMASMSQCRRLTVMTKQRGKISAACWDLDHINNTKKWSLIILSDKEMKKLNYFDLINEYKSGTLVIWEKLDRISESPIDFDREFDEKLNFADKHLSLVFHRFFENKQSNIYFELNFNNRLLVPIDPYMTANPATQPLEEETLFIEKIPIKIKPYITPFGSKMTAKERHLLNEHKDLNLKQGLYIYRNKRLIVWGKWFRLLSDGELKRLSKVRVDLPNSIDTYWTIDVKKSSAQIPSVIKDKMKQIVIRAVGKSEKVYRYRGRKLNTDNYEHMWNKITIRDKIQYLINRDIPMYTALSAVLDDNQSRLLDNLIKSLEDSFPFAAVYYDLAKDQQFEEKLMDVDQVYELAKNTINALSFNTDDQIEQFKKLKSVDIFQKYPEALKLLEEEFNNDK